HGVDSLSQPAFLGEPQKQHERFVGKAVLRVIEKYSGGFSRQPLATLGIFGKELPQVDTANLRIVCFERLPGGTLGKRLDRRRHVGFSSYAVRDQTNTHWGFLTRPAKRIAPLRLSFSRNANG